MIKLSFRRVFGLALAMLMAGSLAVSCYDDSELRSSIDDLKSQLTQLQSLVSALQNDDAVTAVTQNSDGSYTIQFKKSGSVTITNGKNGKDGQDGQAGKDGSIISVVKGAETYTFVFADGSTFTLPRYCESRVLSFEDADYHGPAKTATYWTAFIDEPQYGGPILYGDGCVWKDEDNTFLSGSVSAYDAATWSGGLSGGGIAISNYGTGILTGVSYDRQLEVYCSELESTVRKGAGNNGSDNFAVVYDAGTWATNPARLVMTDGQARVIESVCVANTAYTLNVLTNGNDYCAPIAADGFFKITATGYAGTVCTGSVEFFLVDQDEFVTGWNAWDLSVLGAVDRIDFSMSGSADLYGDWGINVPTYFAIDDITVRVYAD